MPTPTGYSRTQIVLHWVVALLLAAQILFEDAIGKAWRIVEDGGVPPFDPMVALHVFGGLAVLAFALWRLVLRARRGVPPPSAAEPALAKTAAHLGHLALYALMIALPVTGAAAWFGGVEASAELHELLKPALILLVALHVAATLWHQLWLKDNLLARMKRASK